MDQRPAPPSGFGVRRPTWDDLAAVASLYAACDRDRLGTVRHTVDDVRSWWLADDRFDDALLVERIADGLLSGYAFFHEDRDPWTGDLDLYLEGRVHPDATGNGIATFLLARAEGRAERAAARAGEGVVVLRTSTANEDERARAFYVASGFVPARHFLHMRIDLQQPLPAPQAPEGVEIRRFLPGLDDEAVWAAMEDAFSDFWGYQPRELDEWRANEIGRVEDFDPDLWFLAEAGDQVVGAALCRLGLPEHPDLGYVHDLGVRPVWRGRGIALALLRTAFVAFHGRGIQHVGLQVDDITEEGAARLYRRAGMRVTRRMDVYEKLVMPDPTG